MRIVQSSTPSPGLSKLIEDAKKQGVDLELSEDSDAVAIEWISRTSGARGSGKKVIATVVAYAKSVGKAVILDAHEGDPGLIDYYQHLGFKPWVAPIGQFGNEWDNGMRLETK